MEELRIELLSNLTNLNEYKNRNNILILRCEKGMFRIKIDSKEYNVTASQNLFLANRHIFKVVDQSENINVTLYIFSLDFFKESTIILESHVLKEAMKYTPNMILMEKLHLLNSFLDQIISIYYRDEYIYRRKIVINLIQNYCIELFEQVRLIDEDQLYYNTNRNKIIVHDFHGFISKYKSRNIEFYAEKLNMSSRHLYTITKKTVQVTPKEIIDRTIIALIKNFLILSELTNQQIAEKLYFSDQSTFGQFFKRCEGISPSAFRRLNKV